LFFASESRFFSSQKKCFGAFYQAKVVLAYGGIDAALGVFLVSWYGGIHGAMSVFLVSWYGFLVIGNTT